MREIKFRVWGKTEKQYIMYPLAWVSISDNLDGLGIEDNEDLVIEQYTGLKDKNGVEIYDGDIVRWCGGFYKIYFDVVQGWRGIDKRDIIPKGQTLYQMTINNVDKPNIVGNIHENPGLLNEEEK